MNRFIINLSIKRKLLVIQIISSMVALTLAILFLLILEITEFKQNIQTDMTAMAELIGNRSNAALLFDDPGLANENLKSLESLPLLNSACIYDAQGQIFSQWQISNHNHSIQQACPSIYTGQISYFEHQSLHIFHGILHEKNQVLGVIYLHADLTQAILSKFKFIGLVFGVLLIAMVITFLLITPMLKLISSPILKLVKTLHIIRRTKDYSIQAVKVYNDELGELVDAFNDMIHMVDSQNQALIETKNRYRALYDNNPTMVFYIETGGRITSVNQFGAKLLGLTIKDLIDQSIFDFVYPEDNQIALDLFNECLMEPQQIHKQEFRKMRQDGNPIWVRTTARLIIDEKHRKNILLVCEDITETRLLTQKIAHQASHDSLTGLANRSEFDQKIQNAVHTIATSVTHALCYFDLDQFKVVNDTCGHLAGDELLRQLGLLLRKHTRQGDVLARLGGDEFGILMKNCSEQHAVQTCEKLRQVIHNFQFGWENRSFKVGVSIGISIINKASGNAVDILKEADAACYIAKEKGRNRTHVFKHDDEELTARQGEMQWVEKIQRGIENNNFCLFGQKIISVSNNDDSLHFETLIRYQDEQGNHIPPGAFLPAAERYNMATSLDRWVISNLFEWLHMHPDVLNRLSLCSVNLSGLSLSDENILEFISDQFKLWNIPTQKICFEITETAAISNLANATRFIDCLRKQGCTFSLDDFGSGLSSFAYLKNLPVDFLKIDGFFVKDILVDKIDLAMVKSINEIGHVIGKKTIAEFVENQEILDILRQLGIDYAQGYGIAKPVPLSELI